jgi:endo-1,3-1,4-beta-glycanase ExoK
MKIIISLTAVGALTIFAAACSSSSPAESSSGGGGSGGAVTGGQAGATGGLAGGAGGGGATGGAGAGGAGAGGAGGASIGGAGGETVDASSDGRLADAASDGGLIDATDGASGDGASASVLGHPDPTATYPKYPGFTLYLVEEFTAPIDLNKDPIWTWSDAMVLEGLARFGEDAITFADGKMKITVSQGVTPAGFSVYWNRNVPAASLKSGEFRTKYNMFRWGRYEASFKAPVSQSNFILSMFAFRTPHWQEWREIDFELVADLPSSLSTNLIVQQNAMSWASTAEEVARTFPFGAQPAMGLPAGYASAGAFHTYAFEALPDHITFFVDGVPIRTKQTGVGANKLIVPERSMKFMFNHWVYNGTAFGGGDPAKNVYPIVGEYDWVRFYKWDQDTVYPCEPVPACLPADDKDLSGNNPKETATP